MKKTTLLTNEIGKNYLEVANVLTTHHDVLPDVATVVLDKIGVGDANIKQWRQTVSQAAAAKPVNPAKAGKVFFNAPPVEADESVVVTPNKPAAPVA